MSSLFSKIIAGEIPSFKVAEDDNHYAFLDIQPLCKGHTLVVPKMEVDYIYDLPDQALGALHIFAKEVADVLKAYFPCNRIGVSVVGLEVPHAHIHLFPINHVGDMDFNKQRIEMDKEEFAQIAEDLFRNYSSKYR